MRVPHCLDDLLDLLPAIRNVGAEQINRIALQYFWGMYQETHMRSVA